MLRYRREPVCCQPLRQPHLFGGHSPKDYTPVEKRHRKWHSLRAGRPSVVFAANEPKAVHTLVPKLLVILIACGFVLYYFTNLTTLGSPRSPGFRAKGNSEVWGCAWPVSQWHMHFYPERSSPVDRRSTRSVALNTHYMVYLHSGQLAKHPWNGRSSRQVGSLSCHSPKVFSPDLMVDFMY